MVTCPGPSEPRSDDRGSEGPGFIDERERRFLYNLFSKTATILPFYWLTHMHNRLNLLLQHLAPQHLLSRFAGWMAECKNPWLSQKLIRWFIKKYQVDTSIALVESLDAYPNFNAFFTRKIKPEARPVVSGVNQIASPADGCISQLGAIQNGTLLQAKGFHFGVEQLLGGLKEYAPAFDQGHFATVYLAPRDYHRVHMPLSGSLKATSYVPGKLFSVNQITAAGVSNLFSRNERLVCLFETAIGPMAIILVGAMLVGSINTVWSQQVGGKKIVTEQIQNSINLVRGSELGYFKMGSTVIVLFANNPLEWGPSLKHNSTIQMGSLLATF
jgi:phosphatidylserine decarboxylase